MPATETLPISDSAAAETAGQVRATRFDPPHEIPRADQPASASKSDTAAGASFDGLPFEPQSLVEFSRSTETIAPALVRQFRTQAQQLAAHLEARQRELDHREAQLHTQLARHEAAARSARLWFQEQHRKLTQRQSEWQRREQEIVARLRSAGGPALAFASGDSGQPDPAAVIDEEIEFRLREAEFHEKSAQLEASYQHSSSLGKKLQLRLQQIEAAEQRLSRGEAELRFARRELHAEREAHAARIEQQARQAADDRARLEMELSQRQSELDQRAEQLAKRSAALEQLHAELLQIQQDTLQAQLAAEELRVELAGKAPSATILESLARIRAKIAEQFQLQRDELERQQSSIVAQTDDLAKQQQALAARWREFDAWTASQHRQIEEQARQLANREQQLQRQQLEQQSQRLEWEAERRELEAEIRRLQTQIRHLEDNALEHI